MTCQAILSSLALAQKVSELIFPAVQLLVNIFAAKMKTAVLVMLLALVGACYAGCLELNTENFEDSVASGVTFVKLYVEISVHLV